MSRLGGLVPLTFERSATCAFFVVLATCACLMPAQTDTWWQLRTGEEMWRSRQIMLRDEFTHTVYGGYWPNHEWLAQVVFYAAYRAGGLPLLTGLCAASVTLSWLLIARLTPGSFTLRLGLLGGGLMLTTASWSLRPQVFSVALFAVTMAILVRRRWMWALPPLFVVWANLHGAVALGGVLVAAAVGATLLHDRARFTSMAVLGAACLIATAATPLGFTLWSEIPASVARLRLYEVLEWQPPGLTLADAPLWIMAAILAALLVDARARLNSSWRTMVLALASLMFFLLALQTRRNIPPFIMCAVPLLGTLIRDRSAERPSVRVERPTMNVALVMTAAAIAVATVSIAWAQRAPRLAWDPVSAELQRAIGQCRGPLYNRYDEGGYLVWFVRDRKVFMDSRQDPFPAEIVLDHIALERSGEYDALFTRYGIGCALAEQDSPLATRLARDGWQRFQGSGRWSVYGRPDTPALLVQSAAHAAARD